MSITTRGRGGPASAAEIAAVWHVSRQAAGQWLGMGAQVTRLPAGGGLAVWEPGYDEPVEVRAVPPAVSAGPDTDEHLVVPVPGRDRPALVVLIGAAGSGKSTWSRSHYLPHQVVCLDRLRLAVADDESEQSSTPAAVRLMNAIVWERLARGLTVVVDATNTTTLARRVLLALARAAGMPAVAVVFDVPLGLCLARNARRPGVPRPGHRWARRVPGRVVYAQHAQACAARMVLAREGWAQVCHVDARGVLR